jgi:serine/threonine protein kinase/tetratricopeptide (TPR) repeat protein
LEETFGRYRLLERIGEGGMAEVWKAKSFGVEGFEKVLVLKRILPALAQHPKFVDMFVHEAKLAVRLSHANIVQVFDLGRVEQPPGPPSYFIAMEYVPGLDLASALAACRRAKVVMPVSMAAFVATEVAKALDHAHRRRDEASRPLGIVHRDISPQNILISWEGEVKVTDFGIAKAKDSITTSTDTDMQLGRIRGKLAYMSPEQARGERIDGRSDLFSLGTVLYEMLTGQNPFLAPSSFETARRLQAVEFPPLALARPDAPGALVEIVAKLLTAKREDRFPDAGRLHEELLGYFFSSGQRSGANEVAELMTRFREARTHGELEAGVLVQEQTGANERTPVEVPQPLIAQGSLPGGGGGAGGAGGGANAGGGERAEPGSWARPADIGERREVTALVLLFPEGERGREASNAREASEAREARERRAGPATDRARIVLARYGALVIEREPTHIAALFGLGDADGQDTDAAARAALVILRARGGAAISAGVHVGRILVDAAGVPIRDERLASLIAGAQALARATNGRVTVSPLAARILRSTFGTEELPGAGRTAPEGGRVVTTLRPPADVGSRFVGRTEELRRLGTILAAATRRQAQLVLLVGDNGIGKTRLLAETERRLSRGNYNVGFYMASCPRNGAESPWSGMTSMLQVLCGIHEGDDEDRIRSVLPRLRALGLQEEAAHAVLGQLGAASSEHLSKTPQGIGTALKAAFIKMVQSLCEDRVHCFAWDDAHSMDESTAEAILATAARPALGGGGLRAVFLFSTRDKLPHAVAAWPDLHTISLGQLPEEDSAKLISARVDARILPPELIDFCRERAGGHPLFLEELIKELIDSGAISLLNGIVKTRLEGATAVPRTLRALIASRVSRLDPKDRIVVQAAAILGDPVLIEVLAALLLQKASHVDRAVSSLAAREIFRISAQPSASFASPMHAEIVLDAIPPEVRKELHAAAAEAYITVVGEDAVEHADRIAQHLYQAGDRDRAATFFARAAMLKIRVRQFEPAIQHLTSALDLADYEKRAPAELVLWFGTLADVVSRVRQAADLPRVAARVLRRVDAEGSLEQRIIARVDAARALSSVHLFQEASKRLDEALPLAEPHEDLHKKALSALVEMAARAGDFTQAARAADKLLAMGELTSPRVLIGVAQARAATGDTAAALAALDRAEELGDSGDPIAASEREKQRVLVHLYSKDFRAAVEASARAVELARSAGLRFETAAALHNLGDARRRLGDLTRAYVALTESMEIAEAAGYERLVSLNRVHLTYIDGLRGSEGAVAMLKDLIRYADARGYFTDGLEGRYLLGALLLSKGELSAAKVELEQVLGMALSFGNKLVADDARETLESL